MRDDDDKVEPTRRQLARKQRRDAGDLSGDLARTLMTIKDAALAKLRLDEDVAELVARARKVTSPVARRRAERALAGELRRFELEEIAAKISSEQDRASEEPRLFHAAEQLRRNSLRDAVAANREAAELARRLWANGLGGFLDVLVAERSLLEAESRLVASETALSTSRVALYVALGGGWQQAEELRLP